MAEKKVEEILMEMAHVLCGRYCSCIECDKDFECDYISECSALYKADYRKQSEGEWIEVDDGVLIGDGKHLECSKCGVWKKDKQRSNFCSHCGARMKGGE